MDRDREMRAMHAHEQRQDELIARLRSEAGVREDDLADLRRQLGAAEHELEDLRAVRDALTPPELPERPGIDLAAAFLPAAERVSGDFYLVAEGPQNATILVVGDVVGHGLTAARRAAFTRTTFAATAPYSDDPCRLLSWANVALLERAGASFDYVTAACVTYHPGEQRLRWAYAGHPPALWLDDPSELAAPRQGTPLGIGPDPGLRGGLAALGDQRGDAALHRRADRGSAGQAVLRPRRRDDRAPAPPASVGERGGRRAPRACRRVRHGPADRRLCLLAARFGQAG